MPTAQDSMESEILELLKKEGIEVYEIEEEHDPKEPAKPYKCLYFKYGHDEDAKKACEVLKASQKWPVVKFYIEPWRDEGVSSIEVLVSNFANEDTSLTEASTIAAPKASELSDDIKRLIEGGKFTEAWIQASKEHNNERNKEPDKDDQAEVLYVSGSKLGDGYLAVNGGQTGAQTQREKGGLFKLANLITKGKYINKEGGIDLKPADKAKPGEFYLLTAAEASRDSKDVAIFPSNEINEVIRYLNRYNPSRVTPYRLEDFYKKLGIKTEAGQFDPRDAVLEEYLKKLPNPRLSVDDLDRIKYPLYKTIDTYGLTDNAFVDFLNKYADANGSSIWKEAKGSENFYKIINLVTSSGKASTLHKVDDPEEPAQLLLNPHLYEKPQSDFYYIYSLFNHYWTNGFEIKRETGLNTGDDSTKMHNLACAMVFENSNILDVIEERTNEMPAQEKAGGAGYDGNQIRTLGIRSWEDIKKLNQKLKNLSSTGNTEDKKSDETSKEGRNTDAPRNSNLPRETKEIDITTINREAYNKTAPVTGTDSPDSDIRKDVELNRGDLFMNPDGKWCTAGQTGKYDTKKGSDVYYRRINTKNLGGYSIGELAELSKEDRKAVISTLEPREQKYLNDIFK